MFGLESRAKDILREWDRAIELYQDFQDDVEEAILKYEEIQRLYGTPLIQRHPARRNLWTGCCCITWGP